MVEIKMLIMWRIDKIELKSMERKMRVCTHRYRKTSTLTAEGREGMKQYLQYNRHYSINTAPTAVALLSTSITSDHI